MLRTVIAGLAAAAGILLASPAVAFGSCADPGYLARFDARLAGPAVCEELARASIYGGAEGTVPIRMITYGTAHTDASHYRGHLEALASRVSTAMREITRLDLRPTTILLSAMAPTVVTATGASAYAVATGWFEADECTVIFFKPPTLMSESYFVVALAHELFHCMQGRSFTAQARQYDFGGLWWVEGTADYFAHLTQPNTDQLDGRAALFHDRSPTTSLLDMSYEASVFFLWLGGADGPIAIRRFIEAMATTPGRNAQLAAMQRRMPLERWIEFGEAYLDGAIRQPGGRPLAGTPQPGAATAISGPRTVTTRAGGAYVLDRANFSYRRGRTYAQTHENIGGGASRFSLSGEGWSDPPDRVLACEADKTFKVLTTSTEGETETTFTVSDVEELDLRACCLVGEWQPTPDSIEYEARLMTDVGRAQIDPRVSFSCDHAGGDWRLVFSAGGDGVVDWRSMSNRCVAREPRGAMIQTAVRNGATVFDWTVVGDGAGMATYTEDSVTWTFTMEIGPMTQTRSYPDAGPPASNGFAFQCTDRSLSVQGIYGLNYGQGEYTRIGAPPRR